ncbi:TlpA family protein disulfide reductase [Fimbriiglobus ruber]|uniref:Thioredoxin family protein n=1 Tax=Fimbriiglobus ruber TaxID=1908690 RepID=A0A225DMR8_9BACT|nr:TlpA disulfide reductase family protein [Fimbriiglobus ruber]OWK40924.1 thioredoxin family protein [Fimbriiglobus ruber]
MTRIAFGFVAIGFLAAGVATGDDKKPEPPINTAAEQLKQLRKQYDEIEAKFMKDLRADRSEKGIRKANDENQQAQRKWREEALAALRKSGSLPEAFDLIVSVLARSSVEHAEMADLLRKHHAVRPDLGKLFHSMVQGHDGIGRAFVEEMAEKSPVATVRGQAALAVGWQAKWRITQDGEMSLGFGEKLTEDQRRQMTARAEKYLTLAATYADAPVVFGAGTVAENARAELAGLRNLPNLMVGKVAPDIEGETIEGTRVKLSDSRGKVTVLVFWATWCGPCMKMVPHEKKLVERMKDKPFALIGVNGDDERAKAQEIAAARGMSWPSFWDAAKRSDGPITRAWNVHVWPTVFVLDAKGVIRSVRTDDDKLDETVDELVKELEKK